jgi:hypothetical protein
VPRRPPSFQVWVPAQTIDEAGLFCVCESRLSNRSPIFFFRPTDGELRQLNAVLRVTLMSSLHNNGDRSVQFPGATSTIKFIYGESIIFQVFDCQSVCRRLRVTVSAPTFGKSDHTAP